MSVVRRKSSCVIVGLLRFAANRATPTLRPPSSPAFASVSAWRVLSETPPSSCDRKSSTRLRSHIQTLSTSEPSAHPSNNHYQVCITTPTQHPAVCVSTKRRRDTSPPSPTELSLIHISEPTRLRRISYAVFCL